MPYSERIPDFGLPKQQHVDNGKLWADWLANPQHWTRNANNDYTALTNFSKHGEEIISAAYFRTNLTFLQNRLKIVTGVRAEQTNIKAEGPLSDPTRNYRYDAAGKVIRGPNNAIQLIEPAGSLAALQRTLVERGTHVNKEYLRLFPSLNASYNITENFIGRFSYSESVGRPDFNQFMGGVVLPDIETINANSRITVNNASIKAWQARTYMARFEYYFGAVGQLSGSAFIRDYKNFFQNVTSVVTPSSSTPTPWMKPNTATFLSSPSSTTPGTSANTGLKSTTASSSPSCPIGPAGCAGSPTSVPSARRTPTISRT